MDDRAEWRAAAESNCSQLRHGVEDLASALDRRNYSDFWHRVGDIKALFKDLKPTLREERERLWADFGNLCQRAKAEEAQARERRNDSSRQKREVVLSKLDEAYHQARGAQSGSDLRIATELLDQALKWMKGGWEQVSLGDDIFHLSDGRMTKADHDACWERWKEVKAVIHYRRREICDFNYGQFHRDACEARGLAEQFPKEAKEKVRHIQSEMKGRTMDKSQFEEVRRILDEAYKIASAVLERRHAEWERWQQERQQKREAWKQKMRDAKSRKLERVERLRDVVSQIQDSIEHCRDLQRDARSSEYEQRVQGWIDEKYDKIRDIEKKIRELEEIIRDIDSKLEE